MTNICSLAMCDNAGAVYTNNKLIIWATGSKPTPCHTVTIVKSPLAIEPPEFVLQACIDEEKVCIDVMTPFRTAQQFSSGPHKEVVLHHAGGAKTLKVKTVADEKTLMSVGGEVPVPLGHLIGETPDAPVPISLSRQFKTAGTAEITKSLTSAIDEAYQNALKSVPPSHAVDGMTSVEILKVSATYGGIMGLHQVTVEIAAEVEP